MSIKNIADPGLVLGLDTEQFYHDASGDPKICTADLLQRLMLVLDSANELNVIRSKQASVVEQNNLINREGNNNIKQYKYINCQITGNPEQVPAIFPIAQSYQYRLLLKGNLPPEMIIHDFGTSFRKYETCGVIHYNESYVSAIVTSRAIERLAEFATRRAEVDRPEEFYIQAKKYFETLADATRKYNTYLATLDKNPVKPANYRSAVALVSLLHDGKKIIYLQVGSYNDEYIASDVVRELTSNMVHELTHALTKEGNPFVKLGKVSYENLLRFNEKYEERLRLGSRLVSDIEDFVLKHYKDDKKIVERLAYAMKAFLRTRNF
ncbi:MAG: hypothetical protein HWD59_05685 [Coxiellaceae bacterium]|nr:MAG: hypothetical protein HWD59_05685 [Coxiellaceae bacterium]